MGDTVKGGLYGEYPSLEPSKLDEGDLHWNNDFRGMYATLLEKWMGLEPQPILGGSFEQFDLIKWTGANQRVRARSSGAPRYPACPLLNVNVALAREIWLLRYRL